jgi:hypothetical protein
LDPWVDQMGVEASHLVHSACVISLSLLSLSVREEGSMEKLMNQELAVGTQTVKEYASESQIVGV